MDTAHDTDPCETDPDEEVDEGEAHSAPQTLGQFVDLHAGSLIYVWRHLLDTAKDSPSPHLLQGFDFERFCWVAYRTS
jgi:hypothetical protein